MKTKFVATIDPVNADREALASIYSDNPFCSVAYSRVRKNSGIQRVLLGIVEDSGRLIEGCYGELGVGRLVSTLEIVSMPNLEHVERFFAGLDALCRERKISRLLINTFGSIRGAQIPDIGRNQIRTARFEYYLDLTEEDILGGLSTNHKRNMKKGVKAGLDVRETDSLAAVDTHIQLMGVSTRRRTGGDETATSAADPGPYQALLKAGVGTLYQTWQGTEAVSSILILNARDGVYYHSAGTSAEGMNVGASVYMITEIARLLKDRGCRTFNLGGVQAGQDGLRRFKKGFGTREVALESFRSFPGGRFREGMAFIARVLREA